MPLPPESFDGAGIYAIYYGGLYGLYQPISSASCESSPIYVGKAVPSGSRRGGFLEAATGRAVSSRLGQHAASIRAHQEWGEQQGVEHLRLEDFACRYLVVDDIWIPLGEAILISHYQPVWNAVVDGFGKHASGAGRTQGRRSLWDELHPGRAWALNEQNAQKSRAEIEADVAAHFQQVSSATRIEGDDLEAAIEEVLGDDAED
ncbi:MAG: Eco29kI family restriction endonuclease [Gaiella sp.]|nr:Eco29kI family restriction endonuclease [Gaiella sp.]